MNSGSHECLYVTEFTHTVVMNPQSVITNSVLSSVDLLATISSLFWFSSPQGLV